MFDVNEIRFNGKKMDGYLMSDSHNLVFVGL